ncbi:MAG: hypothetical protein QJR14_05430 [Bacillota bacterium]|nr:hypothetical protein [Bacillota bacterium]
MALAALLLAVLGGCSLSRPAEGGPVVRPLPTQPLQPAPVAPFAERIDVARDGSALWVTSSGDVYVQEGAGSRAAPRRLARGWRSAFWYRTGLGVIGVRREDGSFAVVYRLLGGHEERLGRTGAPDAVQVTQAGRVAWPSGDGLALADPMAESRTFVSGVLRGATAFRLAPDGSQVALARGGRLECLSLAAGGTGSRAPVRALGRLAGDRAFDWSPDGRWLVWAAAAEGGRPGSFVLRAWDSRRDRVATLWEASARDPAVREAGVAALRWLPGRRLLLVELVRRAEGAGGSRQPAGREAGARERRYLLVDFQGPVQVRLLPFAGGPAWPVADGSGFLFLGPAHAPSEPARGRPAVWGVLLPETR